MSRKDAAKYLGRAEKTMAMWELEKKGPPSVLVGGRRFYFKSILSIPLILSIFFGVLFLTPIAFDSYRE